MEADQVNSLATLLEYIFEHEEKIFVRAKIAGAWRSCSLKEVSPAEKGKFVASWIEDGVTPFRIKD